MLRAGQILESALGISLMLLVYLVSRAHTCFLNKILFNFLILVSGAYKFYFDF